MLVTLASDSVKFSDVIARVRTLARTADLLWDSDRERARSLFRAAWEASDAAEKAADERYWGGLYRQRQDQTSGFSAVSPRPAVRSEVLRLAAKHDRSLGEEFLRQQAQSRGEATEKSRPGPLGNADASVRQRMEVARQLVDADLTEQALQFAAPALGVIDQVTVDFFSTLREKRPVMADEHYAALLSLAASDPQSDANTVSVLSSYLFTPHQFLGFTAEGTHLNGFPGNQTPPEVAPALQLAFFRTAASILLRPLAPPGQEQDSAGHGGHYLVIKRLMPLFEQRAPAEMTAALRAQLEALAPLTTKETRDRDDDDLVRSGIRPDKKAENREQTYLDQLDHAQTSADRDRINLKLAGLYASKGDLRARERVEEIDDRELRTSARTFIDTRLAANALSRKDASRVLELCRTGEFAHLSKVYFLTQAAKLLRPSENEKALTLIDFAATEARRIGGLDPDSPRAFLAVANAMLVVNRAAVWDAMTDAIKASNSADGFGGEDGEFLAWMTDKEKYNFWSWSGSAPDFDVDKIFGKLTALDYDKSVELAQGLSAEAPRAVATIAIAQAVLSDKKR
ncbi:MAG TPA: hypothetical protein VKD91_11655 [Pyrinomonadaceae bacterium]|nr:hypothetical protein [Pyrinomonadaceae bacterium]